MTPQVQPMLARRLLRLAVVGELQAKLQGVNVMSPGAWPTPPEKLPAVLVRVPREDKQSIQRGMPEFNTTCSIELLGQVQAATPEEAQDVIDDLAYQVEEAVLKGFWIVQIVQQFSSVTTEVEINTEGKQPLAGFKMTIACETFEAFDPTVTTPDGTTWPLPDPVIAPFQGVNLHADMAAPFDATGTYPAGPFPDAVPAAPRTTGPDGRDEGYVQIDLPQT